MNPYLIIWLLAVHWCSDFILQTDEMARSKSSSNAWLTRHVWVYTIALLSGAALYNGFAGLLTGGVSGDVPASIKDVFVFAGLNGVLHWVTDWFTSRRSADLWKEGRRHDFFVCIGADQLVHTGILILTASWLLV